MFRTLICFVLTITACTNSNAYTGNAAQMKVGIGRKVITPKGAVWMNGYASPQRAKPSTGVTHDLWAKALAFEGADGSRSVIVTTDLLGLSHEISVAVATRLQAKYNLKRSQVMLNSSHTHSGPMVWPSAGMFEYGTEDMRVVYGYTLQITEDIIATVDMAMAALQPMTVYSGKGIGDFAQNRREAKWTTRPVDNDVPVMKVATLTGEIKAVLFGYACHNTTLGGDFMEINGDYTGYAQLELEKAYPGITALFFQGCCGDINPNPRGVVQNAEQNGRSLAQSVQKVLSGVMTPVSGNIRSEYMTVDLDFQPFDLQAYQKDMINGDQFVQRRAKLMLQAYNRGWDVSKYNYPVQAIRFGKDLTILAMAGEVVVDYSLWAKKRYASENLFVAGYSNEVMCYIPSLRILKEGGYEGNSSMIYYVMPGPFAENVEEKILGLVNKVMKSAGAKASGK